MEANLILVSMTTMIVGYFLGMYVGKHFDDFTKDI